MSLFRNSKKVKPQIAIADCINAKISEFTSSAVEFDENMDINSPLASVLSIKLMKNGALRIVPAENFIGKAVVNSVPLNEALELASANTLQVGGRLFIIFCGANAFSDARKLDFSKWMIFNSESGMVEDEVEYSKISSSVAKRGLTGKGLALCPKGTFIGFLYDQLFEEKSDEIPSMLETTEGSITCPMCWLKFDIGDAFNIAAHESLRGDPVLGSEEMLRFLPTSFDSEGIALDPAGMPAHDLACPHCRKRLPPGYLDLTRHIFSIVGAPSSGKSYYLSVLIKELQVALYKHYGVTFKDLDPTGNILLTQMKSRLFSAERPEDAILAKTALEGAMYERYPRYGKMVALPKPMTYAISKGKEDNPKDGAALIFYDNAGEHFEPGLDLEDSPGAMHVASSSALFFLFDPAANRYFKRVLSDNPDPQLKITGRLDQQDTILAEMEIRIKRILGLPSVAKVRTPLAVIIGKYDLWKSLLKTPLEDYYVDGKLSLRAVNRNSAILRDFMLETDPSIVAGAESISYDVRFFAVSPLGHSPIKITEGEAAGKIAPVPSLLNPMNVEVPTLWALSVLEPEFVDA